MLSPDSRELGDYEEYCRRELPRRVRAALEEIVHNESQPMEDSIRNQLLDIIRDCQDRVFSSYRSSSAAGVSVGTPSRNPVASDSFSTASQESVAMVQSSPNATPENSFGRIAPPFFQPPPPQIHLRSGLEVSDLQGNKTNLQMAAIRRILAMAVTDWVHPQGSRPHSTIPATVLPYLVLHPML